MSAYTYNPNRKGMAAYLSTSGDLRRHLQHKGEMAIALYRAGVKRKTGRNAREVRYQTTVGGKRKDRMIGEVIAYAPYSAYREWGTVNNDAERNLRAVARKIGSV
ncbi:hypothetical protein C8K36_102448 [Rhodococcus sp. OK519]|uniref:hypothetical protein n=1 Tax=Rhodococcus sp. OK519 TaxID=2135729 RepID=UPI000D3A09DB|nr:hypothetical protein C8K36_102448 [Rhodococcus sp. OK519]